MKEELKKKRKFRIVSKDAHHITMTSLEDCVKKRKSDMLRYKDENIDEDSESWISPYFDHTYECFEVDIAWNCFDIDLKSLFSANLSLEESKLPLSLVSSFTFAGHVVGILAKKLFLYVVSKIEAICTKLMIKWRIFL